MMETKEEMDTTTTEHNNNNNNKSDDDAAADEKHDADPYFVFDFTTALKNRDGFADVVFVKPGMQSNSSSGGSLDESDEHIIAYGHRVILAAHSLFFRKLFTSKMAEGANSQDVSPNNRVVISIPSHIANLDAPTLQLVLKHMYGNRLSGNLDQLVSAKQAAAVLETTLYFAYADPPVRAIVEYLRDHMDVSGERSAAKQEFETITTCFTRFFPLLEANEIECKELLYRGRLWRKTYEIWSTLSMLAGRLPTETISSGGGTARVVLRDALPQNHRDSFETDYCATSKAFECAGYRWRLVSRWRPSAGPKAAYLELLWDPPEHVSNNVGWENYPDVECKATLKHPSNNAPDDRSHDLHGNDKIGERSILLFDCTDERGAAGLTDFAPDRTVTVELCIKNKDYLARWQPLKSDSAENSSSSSNSSDGQEMKMALVQTHEIKGCKEQLRSLLCNLSLLHLRQQCFVLSPHSSGDAGQMALGSLSGQMALKSLFMTDVLLPWCIRQAAWCRTPLDAILFTQRQLMELPDAEEKFQAAQMSCFLDAKDACRDVTERGDTSSEEHGKRAWQVGWNAETNGKNVYYHAPGFVWCKATVSLAIARHRKIGYVKEEEEDKSPADPVFATGVFMSPNDWSNHNAAGEQIYRGNAYNVDIEMPPNTEDKRVSLSILSNPIAEVLMEVLVSGYLQQDLREMWVASDQKRLAASACIVGPVLGALLSADTVALESELQVLQLVLQFCDKAGQRSWLTSLLGCVRFQYIDARDVVTTLRNFETMLQSFRATGYIAGLWEKQAQDERAPRTFLTIRPNKGLVNQFDELKAAPPKFQQLNEDDMMFRSLYGLAEVMSRNSMWIKGLEMHMARYTEYLAQLEETKKAEETKKQKEQRQRMASERLAKEIEQSFQRHAKDHTDDDAVPMNTSNSESSSNQPERRANYRQKAEVGELKKPLKKQKKSGSSYISDDVEPSGDDDEEVPDTPPPPTDAKAATEDNGGGGGSSSSNQQKPKTKKRKGMESKRSKSSSSKRRRRGKASSNNKDEVEWTDDESEESEEGKSDDSSTDDDEKRMSRKKGHQKKEHRKMHTRSAKKKKEEEEDAHIDLDAESAAWKDQGDDA